MSDTMKLVDVFDPKSLEKFVAVVPSKDEDGCFRVMLNMIGLGGKPTAELASGLSKARAEQMRGAIIATMMAWGKQVAYAQVASIRDSLDKQIKP